MDLKEDDLRWFDHWLKGLDTGITSEPPIKLFVMGENRWQFEYEWPLARTHFIPYFLHSGGQANSVFGDGTLSPESPGAEPPAPEPPIHHLDPDAIVSLLKRADALIASGDVAAARLVLRRAADARDAHAAMTLAETYDPSFLEKLGVHGFVPDLAMARGWYEKAKQFGATEATQRLELLASKQH